MDAIGLLLRWWVVMGRCGEWVLCHWWGGTGVGEGVESEEKALTCPSGLKLRSMSGVKVSESLEGHCAAIKRESGEERCNVWGKG